MFSRLRTILDLEHDRLILFAPVLLAAGSIFYFHLLNEPPYWLGAALFAAFALLAYRFRRHTARYAFITAMLVAAGILSAQIRTLSIEPAILQKPMNFAHVKGKLESIEQTPKGSKLILKELTIEGLAPDQTPHHISLTLRTFDPAMTAGQLISLRAGLFPPPQPALPGGFDFARHYYFNEIGAVGYGIPPVAATPLAESGDNSFDITFASWRHSLTQAIRSHFSEPAGSIGAAFITGQTQTIPNSVNDEMRVVGLYHLLAVSGMNLSVVAGIAFFSVRLLLAAVPSIALRYPIKKWAAITALIMSYIYLEVAGSPVSAQRAFLMVSLIFIAILLDRDPSPMRSIAISAFLILCVTPESALSASFQLSYSATAALIASYEWGTARIGKGQAGFGLTRIFFYFAAVMATSLVAWLGTEPFIIYNFNQFSSYSLLANTVAEPLVSFLLMPLVIAGVLLMPLGLSFIAFVPMQYGLNALLALTDWVAGLPHAMWIVPSPTDAGFVVTVAGLLWLYFWKTRWRMLGIPLFLAGMSTAFAYVPPDVLVSNDGKHIAVRLPQGVAMLKGRKDSFIAGQWAHASIEHELIDKKQAPLNCDDKGCTITVKNHLIALPRSEDALADDCAAADIVIATDFPAVNCPAKIVIDQPMLERGGAVSLQLESMTVKHAAEFQGHRPWTSKAGIEE